MSALVRRFLLPALALLALSALAPGVASARSQWLTYRAGPYRTGNFNVLLPKQFVRAPQRDGYITQMYATLHYSNGRRVPLRRVMLHHLVFLNAGSKRGSKRTTCAGRSGEPFWGTGEEHEALDLPRGYGYPVNRSDRWRMQVMLMTHSLDAGIVYVQYRFRFVTGERLRRVRPFWIRANGCNPQPSYSVPGGGGPNSTHNQQYTWIVPFNGRIVFAGGHLHGGARRMFLTEPSCGSRELLNTDPLYGRPDDPVYRIRPILHEPGPVSTRAYRDALGIPVHKGEKLLVNGLYDNEHARARVMSIQHVYVTPTKDPGPRCGPVPKGHTFFNRRAPGRSTPPYERIPLNVLGDDSRVRAVDSLPGPVAQVKSGAVVDLIDNAFSRPNVALRVGDTLSWRFADRVGHNVLLANGPAVVGSPTLSGGATHTTRFVRAGRYQLFCYLHPVTMHQQVDVLRKDEIADATTELTER